MFVLIYLGYALLWFALVCLFFFALVWFANGLFFFFFSFLVWFVWFWVLAFFEANGRANGRAGGQDHSLFIDYINTVEVIVHVSTCVPFTVCNSGKKRKAFIRLMEERSGQQKESCCFDLN